MQEVKEAEPWSAASPPPSPCHGAIRQPPMRVNISSRGTPDGEGARPRAREDVPEANGAFSSLIREGYGLRERRIARTRSLPALGPAAAGLSRSGSLWSLAPVSGLVRYRCSRVIKRKTPAAAAAANSSLSQTSRDFLISPLPSLKHRWLPPD